MPNEGTILPSSIDAGRETAGKPLPSGSRARPELRSPRRPAVVDVGSNSVRLVIWDGTEPIPKPLFDEKASCGLGANIGVTGRLAPEGAVAAIDCLTRFSEVAKNFGVDHIEFLATAAVREAEDGEDFIVRARGVVGAEIRVLSGDEEAELTAEGVLWGTRSWDDIVGDLGGGSLELIRVDKGEVTEKASLPLGPLRLASIGDSRSKKTKDVIDQEISRIGWLNSSPVKNFIAVGGSWRSLAKVHMAWNDYPLRIIHGYRQSAKKIDALSKLLIRQTEASISQITVIGAKRKRMLPLAALVLNRLLRPSRPQWVEFSAFGLREGWLRRQISAATSDADSFLAFTRDYALRHPQFNDRGRQIFDWLEPLFPKETKYDCRIRRAVCDLMDVAWSAHSVYRPRLAMERVLDWQMLPADHYERAKVGLSLAWRYGGCPIPAIVSAVLTLEDQFRAQLLGRAVRLADSIFTHSPQILNQCTLQISQQGFVGIQSADGKNAALDPKSRSRRKRSEKPWSGAISG